MKKILSIFVVLVLSLSSVFTAYADTHVKGYYRKNGTFVQPHYRSDRNGTKADNWSTKGNINPYTGKVGTKNIYNTYIPSYTTPSYSSPSYYNYNTPSYNNSFDSYTPTFTTKKSCSDSYGAYSYENLEGNCSCISGYIFGKDNQCISLDNYCKENHGEGANYNYLSDKCECGLGYEVENNICVQKTYNYNYQVNNNILENQQLAIGILNNNTKLRKTPGTNGEIIKVIKKGTPIVYSKNFKTKVGNYYWTIIGTSDNEFGYMITDTIDFVKDYEEK
ncbi:hypothetical protein BKN14_00245 [Candidatus Gracilibacteria bacterium HOT-871]|nr:hypothetical protein BKN14_00245 [Candidatus Gracilibacteria bacterium HOT-871]